MGHKILRLQGKVAIVTGAAQGIGKGIAIAMAKEGAKLVVSDISDKATEVVGEIHSLGTEAVSFKVNVADYRGTKLLAEATVKRFGRIDILVNNAGIYPFKSLVEMKEEEWDKVIGVNLKGTFNCTQAVLPKMLEQKSGNIINICSIAGGVVGMAGLTHYAASKGGVLGFTRAAAVELAPFGVRVNAIAPGSVQTPSASVGATEEAAKQFLQAIPMRRIGQPNDIANLALFLASESSSYITGQLIVADGGYTAQ